MTIAEFIKKHDLENSILMGYYGGGNYGDELLLEVLMNLLAQKGVKNAKVAYMPYCNFSQYHHDFGYKPFVANSPAALLKAMATSQNIIIGGGGIWGLDAKLQPLLMSVALFIARVIFGCNVYLIGVGYYKSTNWYGHLGAWLAAKASKKIIGRDAETVQNFSRFTDKASQDVDMAWYLSGVDTNPYAEDLAKFEKVAPVKGKTLFITLRRFSAKHQNSFNEIMHEVVQKYQNKNIIVAILEPESIDPESYAAIKSWQLKYPNVTALDFKYNPIALYLFLQKYREDLVVISPQFHAIISAHLQGVPFMPLVYDNKVSQLMDQIGITSRNSVYSLRPNDVFNYVNSQE